MITNILSYLDAMAQRFPDKTAIADEKTFLTFAEWKYQAEVIGTALGIATDKQMRRPVLVFVSQNGEGACTAHDLYYAMNEASFFAACEGMSGQGILKLEEDITKALIKDWKKYDVYGAVKC